MSPAKRGRKRSSVFLNCLTPLRSLAGEFTRRFVCIRHDREVRGVARAGELKLHSAAEFLRLGHPLQNRLRSPVAPGREDSCSDNEERGAANKPPATGGCSTAHRPTVTVKPGRYAACPDVGSR